MDPLIIRDDGTIASVAPSHGNSVAGFAQARARGFAWRASGKELDTLHGADRAADDNYATLWYPMPGKPATLNADLGATRGFGRARCGWSFPVDEMKYHCCV